MWFIQTHTHTHNLKREEMATSTEIATEQAKGEMDGLYNEAFENRIKYECVCVCDWIKKFILKKYHTMLSNWIFQCMCVYIYGIQFSIGVKIGTNWPY